ncbi:MAG TPA: VWA domain-containing protein [Candidatus Acidoferrum sp.]|nr:VWA domain-containing protein [Candidatus Acidoferrum sp.]
MRRLLIPASLAATVLLIAISFTVPAPGQGVADDEIRFGTRPYVPPPENAIKIRTDLVEVPVVVRDANGAAVKDLTKDNFEVYDENKKRDISFFAVETAQQEAGMDAAPGSASKTASAQNARYVAFYFDDLNMPPGDTNAALDAAKQFVREHIKPGDKAGVFTSSKTVIQDFTDDQAKLLDAIGKIRPRQKKAGEGAASCPVLIPFEAYLIIQNPNSHTDALDLAMAQARLCGGCGPPPGRGALQDPCGPVVNQIAGNVLLQSEQFAQNTFGVISDVIRYLASQPGQRMLVLTSSGFMAQTTQPKLYEDKVVDASLRAGIVINTLDAKGMWVPPPGGEKSGWMNRVREGSLADYQDRLEDMQKEVDNDPLRALAEGTGGQFFHNSNDLGRGYREVALPPEVSYVLGFAPDPNPDGKLHTLKVKLTNPKGFNVLARRGYYPQSTKDSAAQEAANAKREKLDKTVQGNDVITDLVAQVGAQQVQLDGGAPGLKVVVHVDMKNLPFDVSGGRSNENLAFITALYDSNGHFITGVEGLMKLSLKDATKDQLAAQGLNAPFSLKLPPGAGTYRLREVVQEQVSGRFAAINTPVEIHSQ